MPSSRRTASETPIGFAPGALASRATCTTSRRRRRAMLAICDASSGFRGVDAQNSVEHIASCGG
jgi:hypothetical protein